MWQQQVFLHKVSVESFDDYDRYNASEMATKEPESQLLEHGGPDPLQLGDGEAPAGEAALRIQVSILSCHHVTDLRLQGQVLPQRGRQVRARQGEEVVHAVRGQDHQDVQNRWIRHVIFMIVNS